MKNRLLLEDVPNLENIPREVRFHIFSFFSDADILTTRKVDGLLKNDIDNYCHGFYEHFSKKLSDRLGGNLYVRYQQEPDTFIKIKKQYESFNKHVLLITDQAFSSKLYRENSPPALLAYRLNNETLFKSLTPNKPHARLLYKSVIYSEDDFGKTILRNKQGIINVAHYKLVCVLMDDLSIMTKALLDIKHRSLANNLELPLIFISTSSAISDKERQAILDLNVNIAGFIPLTTSKKNFEHDFLRFDRDLPVYLGKLKRFLTFTALPHFSNSPSTSY